ncbi:CTP synthase [Pseudobacteriovorax antillogorgiicola]|uniref:CTP synthase n=1 Tax=Pseudobacteriovorax antillogorgiicola TaxID=1513793 RepID=A0A1Y6B4D8_9BACT|nr:CTP synthase [Pseudobacteriovorax antillogorgiicola]TCS59135.1 CTP synthase [Pseudobacteriovorax antillogorgiicola]SME91306.1 CTP synthase [Pseudobacteriovorax antillogorgiicola]
MGRRHRTKFIFVTGGVVSSLGKGIVGASVGALLENRGLKVSLTKVDPYLNVDPGTMSPFQHGEVFVTDDGAETDLDIGHYERYTSARLTRANSFSTGQVYDTVLSKERRGDYLGGTVQVIPHVTDQIKQNIYASSEGADVGIIEIGGTVGDIESLPFLEAIRQIQYDLGEENVLYLHLTLVPYIGAAHELKTKPTQHSVKELRQIGIQPHILVCRADRPLPEELKHKIGLFCNVKAECVVDACDVDNIYKVPLYLHNQGLDQLIVDHLNIWTRNPDLLEWKQIEDALDHPRTTCKVAIVGKYTDVIDSYKSINESLVHSGIANRAKIEVEYVDATEINSDNVAEALDAFDGVIVPGGFGNRGTEGKIEAIRHLRESKKPFLGICLGMQLAAVEFARNALGLSNAHSVELNPNTEYPIIHLMEEQKDVEELGGTMRLGAYPCTITSGSKAMEAYKKEQISERHRHRYEFNNDFRDGFREKGMVFSGMSPDETLVEMIELQDHPWFVGCQFHPELKSSPMEPHPLFRDFVRASIEARKDEHGR